jgi:hypothetical protein
MYVAKYVYVRDLGVVVGEGRGEELGIWAKQR